jgi:hypothetical protein
MVPGKENAGAVINGFNKAIAQRIQGSAHCSDIFRGWSVLLGLRAYSTIIDNRAAGNCVVAIIDKDSGIYKVAILISAIAVHTI